MRLRNVKGASEIIENSKYILKNYNDYRGNFKAIFKNKNPLNIEIGMGKGDFIIGMAKKYPNINFIGIEKFDSVLARAIQKSNEVDVNNLVLLRYDAEYIDEIFDKEIDKIYLNFSDPWPKARHEKRRLTSKSFLDKYKIISKKDVIIEMKTDNIDLFNYSLESFKDNNYNIIYKTNDLHNEDIDNIETEYEEKFSSQGIKINKLIAKK